MARNSTGTLAIVVPVVAAESYSYSTQDDLAAISEIPATTGTTLYLPAGDGPGQGPSLGDSYAWADVDGSCSPTSPLVVVAPNGTTIRGGGSLTLTSAFAAGRVTFVDNTSEWSVQSLTETSATGAVTLTGAVTGSGPASDVPTTLAAVVTPGTVGTNTRIPVITYNAAGQITGSTLTTVQATLTGAVTGSGPVTGIATTLAPGTPGTVPTVRNIAALEALATTGFSQGQLAVVESVGAIWSYQPAGALTVDGIGNKNRPRTT